MDKTRTLFLLGLVVFVGLFHLSNGAKFAKDEDKMGMGVLYDMVHFFLGDIVQPNNISESFLNLSTVFENKNIDSSKLSDWNNWADYAKGYAAGVVVGLLFIILMPIIGLFFCCCRLCGKCGGKPRKDDTRRSKYKRRTYCTLIVVFNTLALAGVVCAFMCSHLLHKALDNENNEGTIGFIRESLTSVKNFTDDAVATLSNEMLTVYNEVSAKSINDINETASAAIDNILLKLNATQHLDKAKKISYNVNKTKLELETVAELLGRLSSESNELRDNLTSISKEIKSVCDGTKSCSSFNPADYETDANFTKLNQLKDEAKKVAETLNMTKYMNQALDTIENAKSRSKSKINDKIVDAQKQLNDIKPKIDDGLNDLTKQVNNAMSFYPQTEKDLNNIDEKIKSKYSDLVYYVCIGVSCVYLFIVILYYLGIVFGLCGERPGHDAPCCNRGTGAKFLMAGVAFTFIFSWILMLLCTLMFVVGGISYTEVCRYFDGHNPSDFKNFDAILNNGFDLAESMPNDTTVKFSLSQSLLDCQNNKAIYSAFKLDHIVDLNSTIDLTDIENRLNQFKPDNINIQNITIMSSELRSSLEEFSKSGIAQIDYDSYFNELNKDLTTAKLGDMVVWVTTYANNLKNDPAKKQKLLQQAERLNLLNTNDAPKIKSDMDSLRLTITELQVTSNLSSSIQSLIDGLLESQVKFNSNKDTLIKEQIGEVATTIFNNIKSSVNNLITQIKTNTARCKPLSDSFYSVSDSVCVLLIDPVNGMWFSFGWCLFFFVLCLIFAVLLTGEYRHELKYGKEFDDPFDGRHNDMMPLTSRMHC